MSKKRKHHNKKIRDDGMYVDYDETFSYIAGFTGRWGAPYGTAWEESGIDPDLPLDEKVRVLNGQESEVRKPLEKKRQLKIHQIKGLFSVIEADHLNDLNLKMCFTSSTEHGKLAVCPISSLPDDFCDFYEGERNEWKAFEITEDSGCELNRLMTEVMQDLNNLDLLYFTIPAPEALYVFTQPEEYKKIIRFLMDESSERQ